MKVSSSRVLKRSWDFVAQARNTLPYGVPSGPGSATGSACLQLLTEPGPEGTP